MYAPSGAPASYGAGDRLELDLSSLAYTGASDRQDARLTVKLPEGWAVPAAAVGKVSDQPVIYLVENGKAVPFATGLNEPRGIAVFQQWFFVADKDQVWRIDAKGKAEVVVKPSAFPVPPRLLIANAPGSAAGRGCTAGRGTGAGC